MRSSQNVQNNPKIRILYQLNSVSVDDPKPTSSLAHAAASAIRVRRAERGDIDALVELEHRVFATDRLSRRSLQRLLRSPTADVIVAEENAQLAGIVIVLFRRVRRVARIYSIAVAPHAGGRGVASMLLDAAEAATLARDRRTMRLEVHNTNHAAVARYRKSGYREFGRHRALLRGRRGCAPVREAACPGSPPRCARAAIFSPDHRIHLRTGLHHDGACLGRPARSSRRPRSSLHYGAMPPPSSPAAGPADASLTGWR